MFNSVSGIIFIYILSVFLSAALLLVYLFVSKIKNPSFIVLYSLIFVVNLGYFGISISNNLQLALMANRLSYLGSVFLPFIMLLIISDVLKIKLHIGFKLSLSFLGACVFLVTASQGILPIYYKQVSLGFSDGASRLIKDYGALHTCYTIYILAYFVSMVAMVTVSFFKKRVKRLSHSILITVSVFLNVLVWLTEKLFENDFEFLSISYIITGAFLWGLYSAMCENEKLLGIIDEQNRIRSEIESRLENPSPDEQDKYFTVKKQLFLEGLPKLTATEKCIFNFYLDGKTTKEILVHLNITENTLKFHNKNIYTKLCVASRRQLVEIASKLRLEKFEITR